VLTLLLRYKHFKMNVSVHINNSFEDLHLQYNILTLLDI